MPARKLTIDLGESPVVEINGVEYRMVDPSELEPTQSVRLGKIGAQLVEIKKSPSQLSEEDAAVLQDSVDRALRIVMPDLPDAVSSRLGFARKVSIIEFFTEAVEVNGEPSPPPSNGANGTRASKRSTGAIRSDGRGSRSGRSTSS